MNDFNNKWFPARLSLTASIIGTSLIILNGVSNFENIIQKLITAFFISSVFILLSAAVYLAAGIIYRLSSKQSPFKLFLFDKNKKVTNYFMSPWLYIKDPGLWLLSTGVMIWIINSPGFLYKFAGFLAFFSFPIPYIFKTVKQYAVKYAEIRENSAKVKPEQNIKHKQQKHPAYDQIIVEIKSSDILQSDEKTKILGDALEVIKELDTDNKYTDTVNMYLNGFYSSIKEYKIIKQKDINKKTSPKNLELMLNDMLKAFSNLIDYMIENKMLENDSKIKALRIDMKIRGLL